MAGLIVLESMWNPRGRLLDEEPSVLPYLKAIRQSLAWEGARVNLVYRRFHTAYDLGLLLREVLRKRKSFRLCYIASHGQRRTLLGLGGKAIRLETLTDYCRPSPSMGFVFGACDFLTPDTALNFLKKTGAKFVAGYQKSIPWTESMLVDSLFLSYLLQITHTENPQKVAAQLYRDFPLSHDITFTLFTLSRRRGRKPQLVSSFELHRRKVHRARRLLRDL
ncbi:MAG: hypothetical protein HYV92_03640 [Candidatus Rokubacteria bacterium]|nr:hypothetical protein [Candidatus Rokubacteria bacterium]